MVITERLKRPSALAAACLLFLASLVPVLSQEKVSAGMVTDRQIKISSSVVSATNVSYYVEFKPATTSTVKSFAVDFCANSPIINDACTATVGTTTPTLSSATVVTNVAGEGNIGAGWTVTITNTGRTFTIANATGVALTAGTSYYFTINAVTNHSTNGTFYGRLLTFPNDVTSNYAGGYTGTNTDTNVPTDTGGIAMSLSAQITITSKVQERLTFCVYTTGTGNDCTSKTGTAVNLGDTNGVLSSSGVFVDKSAKYSVQTNATGNAAIRLKGATLTSGSYTIDAAGATAVSAPAANTEFFGLCNFASAGLGLTASAPYAGGTGSCSATTQTSGTATTGGDGGAQFAYDTSATGLGSVYGQAIASKAPGDFSTGTLALVGQVANTTEAGIYTATLTFIATGTY